VALLNEMREIRFCPKINPFATNLSYIEANMKQPSDEREACPVYWQGPARPGSAKWRNNHDWHNMKRKLTAYFAEDFKPQAHLIRDVIIGPKLPHGSRDVSL